MNKIWKYLKESKLTLDFMIVIFGILLILFLILAFFNPQNSWYIRLTFSSAGLVNILNGLKIVKDKKKRNMGLTYMLFGIVLFFIGYITSM